MRRAPRNAEPAQRWRAFLHNHREAIAAKLTGGHALEGVGATLTQEPLRRVVTFKREVVVSPDHRLEVVLVA
jgi:hypothetical protein